MDIRERNGIRIAEILEKVGPEDAAIKVDGNEWNLEVYYLKGNPDCWNPKLCVKGEELDRRLAVWLENLKIQGYISNGQVQK